MPEMRPTALGYPKAAKFLIIGLLGATVQMPRSYEPDQLHW